MDPHDPSLAPIDAGQGMQTPERETIYASQQNHHFSNTASTGATFEGIKEDKDNIVGAKAVALLKEGAQCCLSEEWMRSFVLERNDAATDLLLLTNPEPIARRCTLRMYSRSFGSDNTISYIPNGSFGFYDFGLVVCRSLMNLGPAQPTNDAQASVRNSPKGAPGHDHPSEQTTGRYILSRETGSLLVVLACPDFKSQSQGPVLDMIHGSGHGPVRQKSTVMWNPPSIDRNGHSFPFGHTRMSQYVAVVDTAMFKAEKYEDCLLFARIPSGLTRNSCVPCMLKWARYCGGGQLAAQPTMNNYAADDSSSASDAPSCDCRGTLEDPSTSADPNVLTRNLSGLFGGPWEGYCTFSITLRNGPGMSKTGPGLCFRVPVFEHNDFENQHQLSITASEMLVSTIDNHMASFHIPSLSIPAVRNTKASLLLEHVDGSQPNESVEVDMDSSFLFVPRHGLDVHGRKRFGSEPRHNLSNPNAQQSPSEAQPEVAEPPVAVCNQKDCEERGQERDQGGHPLAGCDKNIPPGRQKILEARRQRNRQTATRCYFARKEAYKQLESNLQEARATASKLKSLEMALKRENAELRSTIEWRSTRGG